MASTKTFQDRDFLVWEVYTTGARDGDPDEPRLVFHCLTQPALRPRVLDAAGDEADAQRMLVEAGPPELLSMLDRSSEIS